MGRSRRAPKTQRQLRVGELLRHALSELLGRGDFGQAGLKGNPVTVTEVRVATDMRHATVFIMPLGGGQADDVLAELGRAAGRLRGLLAGMVQLKYSPQLEFTLDLSFEQAAHIDRLLKSPKVAADLQRPQDDTEDDAADDAPDDAGDDAGDDAMDGGDGP